MPHVAMRAMVSHHFMRPLFLSVCLAGLANGRADSVSSQCVSADDDSIAAPARKHSLLQKLMSGQEIWKLPKSFVLEETGALRPGLRTHKGAMSDSEEPLRSGTAATLPEGTGRSTGILNSHDAPGIALRLLSSVSRVVQHVQSGIALHLSSTMFRLLQDAREVLCLELIEKILRSEPKDVVMGCIYIIGCLLGVPAFVYYMKGRELMMSVLPVGFAVSLCIIFSFHCHNLWYPLNHFSPTSAMITVVIVMEITSFERFMIKNSLRALGTLTGGAVATIIAEISELLGHPESFVVVTCFAVFTLNAIMAKQYKDIAYVFLIASVTFAVVFFGYIQKGDTALWARLISILFGEMSAIICTVFFSWLNGDWHSAKSAINIVRKLDVLFSKVLVAIECGFTRNMIVTIAHHEDESDGLAQMKEYAVRAEVREFFGLDSATNLEMLKVTTLSLSFASFSLDSQASAMHDQCNHSWEDMMLVRSLAPRLLCGRQPFCDLPNLDCIGDRLFPLYLQASALAHAAHTEPEVWKKERHRLEIVRGHMQKMQQSWSIVCKLIIQTLKDTHLVFATAQKLRDEFMTEFKDMAETLQSNAIQLASVRSDRAEVNQAGSSQFQQGWRFDAFCQSLDVIIAESSSLVLLLMKIMQIDEGPDAKLLWQILTKLSGMDEAALKEAVVVPAESMGLMTAILDLAQPNVRSVARRKTAFYGLASTGVDDGE